MRTLAARAYPLLFFAAVALAGNAIGSTLRYPNVGTAVLFPPYAALTAALLASRRKEWIWYILISSLTHFAFHWPEWSFSWVMVAEVANLTKAIVAAILLNRCLGSRPSLDSIRTLSLFVVAAVLIAPAAGATVGAANVVLQGASPTYWKPWMAWFVSNAITGLTMLPAFMWAFNALSGRIRIDKLRRRAWELLLLAVAVSVTCLLAFVNGLGREYLALPLYASLPVFIWSAVRFGAGGASVALTMVTLSAVWSVDRGTGPFLSASPDENVLALQAFVLCTAVPVLCLAAIAGSRERVARLHQALLASLHDHVAILDADGIVLEANQSWQQFADGSDGVLFRRVREGDHYLSGCESLVAGGDVTAARVFTGVASVLARERQRVEIEYDDTLNGRMEAYTVTVEALERPEGGAVISRANVTERRRAHMEIADQRNQLSHLTRVAALGQLSGAFAHELHQPLTAILSNAEAARALLKREPVDLDYLAGVLEDIIADDQRAAAMIDRLRALLKQGDTRFHMVTIDEVIDEVLELAKTELISRGVRADSTIDRALPAIWGDKVQLQQVLLNLVLNSCEAMESTIAARRQVHLIAEHDGPGSIHIAVRDWGAGIQPDVIDRLFNPFVTTKASGLGLGLSISRTIIAAHGGRLWAENNANGGATVHCLLPVRGRPSKQSHAVTLPPLAAS